MPEQLLEATRSIEQALGKASDRVRDWLTRRLDQDSLDIARLYQSSRDRFVDRIRHIYETYLRDEPTFLRAKIGMGGRELDRVIGETVSSLANDFAEEATGRLRDTLEWSPKVLNRHLSRWATTPFKELPETSRRVMNELTTAVVGGGTFFDRAFHINEELRHSIFGGIRQGLLNGDDFNSVRNKMLKVFGVDRLKEPTGHAYSSVKIYKNEARRQWNLLMKDIGKEAGGIQVWWAMLDANSTPGCVARHGRKLSELGNPPPRHFNCRCTVAIFPAGFDPEEFTVEADVWLQANGYTRRQAMLQEAERGWSWGFDRLQPLLLARADAGRIPYRYRALPWHDVTTRTVQGQFLNWLPRIESVQSQDRPDMALLRQYQGRVEAKTWRGWRPLASVNLNERWIEVSKGFVLDSADTSLDWEQHAVRLPLDVYERWPALRQIAFPILKRGEVYAGRFFDPQSAVKFPLTFTSEEWVADESLERLFRKLLGAGVLPDSYFALAIRQAVPDSRGMVQIEPSQDLRTIVALATGQVIFQRTPFPAGLGAPYQRVALAVLDDEGQIWTVRPRGLTFWALPGGHIEPDESASQAAVREMKEETGVTASLDRLLGTLYRPWSTTTIFLGHQIGGQDAVVSYAEIDAVAKIPLSQLAADERIFLQAHLRREAVVV